MLRIVITLAFLAALTTPAEASAPSLRKMGMDASALASLIGDSQMVLIHKPRSYSWMKDGDKVTKKASFISSLKVVNAPVEKVRAVVADVAKYPEFIAEIEEVETRKEGDETHAEFETELNLMVISVGVDYTLAYTNEAEGDLTWRLVAGDVGQHVGRWEFFDLGNGKTLLSFTHWQDLESIGLRVRAVLRAQPDMKLVIPVAWAAVVMNSIHRRAEGLPREERKPPVIVQKEPKVPMLSTGGASFSVLTLRRLAEAGTLMFVHPKQWFLGKGGKPTDFSFMSAAAVTNLPVEKLKTLTTSFPRFPEFLEQVDSIKPAEQDNGKRSYDFSLKVGISIFTIPVRYRLEYTDVSPLAISYQRASGDMDYIYGAWEFFDVGDGKSLVMYTTGNKMGDNAPAMLKVGKNMPNRDLIVGVSSTALTIQKLVPWLQKQ